MTLEVGDRLRFAGQTWRVEGIEGEAYRHYWIRMEHERLKLSLRVDEGFLYLDAEYERLLREGNDRWLNIVRSASSWTSEATPVPVCAMKRPDRSSSPDLPSRAGTSSPGGNLHPLLPYPSAAAYASSGDR